MLTKTALEKANCSSVVLMDELWENRIPDANIFAKCVKELFQKLCEILTMQSLLNVCFLAGGFFFSSFF